jgi:hypothetical protein
MNSCMRPTDDGNIFAGSASHPLQTGPIIAATLKLAGKRRKARGWCLFSVITSEIIVRLGHIVSDLSAVRYEVRLISHSNDGPVAQSCNKSPHDQRLEGSGERNSK